MFCLLIKSCLQFFACHSRFQPRIHHSDAMIQSLLYLFLFSVFFFFLDFYSVIYIIFIGISLLFLNVLFIYIFLLLSSFFQFFTPPGECFMSLRLCFPFFLFPHRHQPWAVKTSILIYSQHTVLLRKYLVKCCYYFL